MAKIAGRALILTTVMMLAGCYCSGPNRFDVNLANIQDISDVNYGQFMSELEALLTDRGFVSDRLSTTKENSIRYSYLYKGRPFICASGIVNDNLRVTCTEPAASPVGAIWTDISRFHHELLKEITKISKGYGEPKLAISLCNGKPTGVNLEELQ